MAKLDNYLDISMKKNRDGFIVYYDKVDLEIETSFKGVNRREGDGWHYPITDNPEVEIEIEEVRLRTENTEEDNLPKINFCQSKRYELESILEDWAIKNVELEIV